MRYSTEPSDPGYEAWCATRKQGKRIRFYLNGKEQDHVILADEETGEMVKLREPLKLGPHREYVRQTLQGKVTASY
jgi:hypothetical protein